MLSMHHLLTREDPSCLVVVETYEFSFRVSFKNFEVMKIEDAQK